MDFVFRPRNVTRFLASIVACLTLAHVFFQAIVLTTGHDSLHGLVNLFGLDGEENIPAFYSGGTMMLAAFLCWVISATRKGDGHGDHRHWFGLTLIFAFLAFDELFFVHERLVAPVRNTLKTSGALYFAWVIPYGVATLGIGAAYLQFVRRLDARIRMLVIVSGIVYVTGAIGFELLGSYVFEAAHRQARTLQFVLVSTVEELFEMAGIVMFVHALLTYIQILGIRVSRAPSTPVAPVMGPALVPSAPIRVPRTATMTR